jgi:hypothetical protein
LRPAAAAPTATDLARLLGADGVLVYAVNGQDLNVVDIWPAHPSADSLTLQVGFGVTGLVARTGKPALIEADSPRNVLHRQLLQLERQQTVARMCIPLPGLEGDVVGVLAAHRDPRLPFGQVDLDTAEPYAAILGLRLDAEQLWRTVNRQRTERDRLIKAAIAAQEAERRRIAFELHDGVTTALASMSFHLSAADLTIYAVQDLEDDALAGVKSSARRLGTAAPKAVFGFYAAAIAPTLAAGWLGHLGLLFWPIAAVYALTLLRQPLRLRLDDPAGALALFRANTLSGFLLFAAIAAGFWRPPV